MWIAICIFVTLWLAYSNGANDNVKGVATLIGSRTLSKIAAIRLAAVATLLGAMCTVALAPSLVKSFGGKGLVPVELLETAGFPLAVAAGAAATVMIATLVGLPISTTHAMTGALVGVGASAAFQHVHWSQLGITFLIPLLFSPLLSLLLAAMLYIAFRALRKRFNINEDFCVCVDVEPQATPAIASGRTASLASPAMSIRSGSKATCTNVVTGAESLAVLNIVHIVSGFALCFARAVNDTAKVIGPLMITGVLSGHWAAAGAGIAMALGGLLSGKKVAETMSNRITGMNQGQGCVSNIVASGLVIFASRLGLPVSTTHVSCGSLFGIGIVSGQGHRRMILTVLLAWVATLPLGIGIGAVCYRLLSYLMA